MNPTTAICFGSVGSVISDIAKNHDRVITINPSTVPSALKSPIRISPKTVVPTGIARQAQNDRNNSATDIATNQNGPICTSNTPEILGRSSEIMLCKPCSDMMRMNAIMSRWSKLNGLCESADV